MDPELHEDILDMIPHSVRAQLELLGDFPVRGSAREQTRNLRLTPGQPQPSECQLRPDLAVTPATHGDSDLEGGKEQSEQRSRCMSWARAARTKRRLDV